MIKKMNETNKNSERQQTKNGGRGRMRKKDGRRRWKQCCKTGPLIANSATFGDVCDLWFLGLCTSKRGWTGISDYVLVI